MLPGSRNVRHVLVQDVLLGADAVILDVLGPVQLAHVKVECLPVLGGELAHQHAQVLRVPLPVLTAEVLQQADGLMQTVEDTHHLRLLSGESQEEVVDERGELVADQDPVLVDQVVGGDVGVGPAESLLQRVPLEG